MQAHVYLCRTSRAGQRNVQRAWRRINRLVFSLDRISTRSIDKSRGHVSALRSRAAEDLRHPGRAMHRDSTFNCSLRRIQGELKI